MASTLHAVGRRMGALATLLACGSVLVWGWGATRGPDAGGYSATDETVYSFVDIAGASGGASILSGTDDGTAVLTVPFPFEFYGQPQTLACVSTNGALYFVPSVGACSGFDGDFANTDLSAAPVPADRPAILPFWTDLTFQVSGSGAVLYQTLGTAPDRRFVVQWNNAYPQGSANPVTFQAILTERDRQILFQYKTVGLGAGNPAHNGALATVGIRDAGSLTSRKYLQWSVNSPVLADRVALLFSTRDSAPWVAGPSNIWLGLKNSDDVGTKFDVLVEVVKNGVVVGSGQASGVPGGSSGFNNAVQRTVGVAFSGPTAFGPGDTLGVRLSVRIATGVSGHRSGTARLWFNDAAANSRWEMVVSGATRTLYLTSGSTLRAAAGTGPKSTVDVFVDRLVGGNAFKPFGTWTVKF